MIRPVHECQRVNAVFEVGGEPTQLGLLVASANSIRAPLTGLCLLEMDGAEFLNFVWRKSRGC